MRETYTFSKEEAISVMEDLADLDLKAEFRSTFTFKGIVSGESREKGRELFPLSDDDRYLINGRYVLSSNLADLMVRGALFLDRLGFVELPGNIVYEARFFLGYLIRANPQLDLEETYGRYRRGVPKDDGYWHLQFAYNTSFDRFYNERRNLTEEEALTRLKIGVASNSHDLNPAYGGDLESYAADFKALYMGIFGDALRKYHSPLTQE